MASILIVSEIQNGKIREASYELAGVAQKLAGETGREVKSLVTGRGIDALAEEFSKRGGGQVLAGTESGIFDDAVKAYVNFQPAGLTCKRRNKIQFNGK